MRCSTIARTLNASYQPQSYGGLGGVATTYPVSAFVTHTVYLKGTSVEVDVGKVTVRGRIPQSSVRSLIFMLSQALGVKCVVVEGPVDERTGVPKFNADCVRQAILGILSEDGHGDRP